LSTCHAPSRDDTYVRRQPRNHDQRNLSAVEVLAADLA
jgi:hypothetical protein